MQSNALETECPTTASFSGHHARVSARWNTLGTPFSIGHAGKRFLSDQLKMAVSCGSAMKKQGACDSRLMGY
jgi:hypothetical protein